MIQSSTNGNISNYAFDLIYTDIEGVQGSVFYWVCICRRGVVCFNGEKEGRMHTFYSIILAPISPNGTHWNRQDRVICPQNISLPWGKPKFIAFCALSDIIVQDIVETAASRAQADCKAHKFICLVLPSLWSSIPSFSLCPTAQMITNVEHQWWPDFSRWPPRPSERTRVLFSYKDPRFLSLRHPGRIFL